MKKEMLEVYCFYSTTFERIRLVIFYIFLTAKKSYLYVIFSFGLLSEFVDDTKNIEYHHSYPLNYPTINKQL